MVMHPSSPPLGKENNSSDEFEFVHCPDKLLSSTVKKREMEASDLLAKHARGRGLKSLSSPSITAVDDNVTTPFHGRRKGSDMKYSSISPPESRVPSAKTISDQCFPILASSTASSSPESLLVDYDEEKEDRRHTETFAMSIEDASPASKALMREMDKVYESAPIPESYFNSPPKKAPVIPEITLHPKQSKQKVSKKNMEASDLLAKQSTNRRSSRIKGSSVRSMDNSNGRSTNTSLAAAKTAYGIKTRSKRSSCARESFSAPNDSAGVAKSQEWDMPSEKPARSTRSAGMTTRSNANAKKKPVALSVQREKKQRAQRLKDANSPSNEKDGRRNLDKRTARLRFADAFQGDILQHRQSHPYLNNGSNHSDKYGSEIYDRERNGVSIAVRKRPIFDYELDRGDYDIVSVDNASESTHDTVVIHNCVMHPDMKQMLMKHMCYPGLTAAFDEHCNDDDIYKHIAEPLVIDALAGSVSTILMFGQTGSGKSHTMSGIESRTVHGLFRAIDTKPDNKPVVTIQFVELCGSKECRDLLVKKSDGQVKLADDEDGSVRLINAIACEVKSPEDLLTKINIAKSRRATEATDKNGVSSRSHAVCQIQIKGAKRGVLTLIDCAGSERRHDSMYHSSERQKETAEINASLYALKECIRARANKSSRIPFRSSTLTRILKESFERDGARLCVIACVAPNATDTEHTMETLKTVASIVGVDDQIREEKARPIKKLEQKPAILPPKMWSHEHLCKFLSHKKMHRVKLSDHHDGKTLMKMSVPQMKAQLFEDRDKDLAQKLFDLLRKENDRVTSIQKKERANLKEQRKGRI